MMLLGVVLHVLIAYWEFPGPSEDLRSPDSAMSFMPYRSPQRGESVEIILVLIHFFRMPGFYLLAGFFGALLIARRGAREYFWNRTTRILFPFVVGWFVLWPMARFSFGMGQSLMYAEPGQGTLANALAENPFWMHLPFVSEWPHDLMHLWFLHYLVLFYIVTVPLALWVDRPGGRLKERLHGISHELLLGKWRRLRFPALIGLTVLATLPQQAPGLLTTFRFTPNPTVFSVYFLFFLVGWVFYAHRDIIDGLRRNAGLWTLLGFAMMGLVVYPLGTNFKQAGAGEADLLMGSATLQIRTYWALHSVAMWLAILGLMGLSERVFTRHHPTVRYVVDASYWVYLIHFPISVMVPVLFHDWTLDADLKMWLMTLLVAAISFVSYHFLVRSTFIGQALNGRRYPRQLPWKEQELPATEAAR